MRNISFSATKAQFRNRTKTETCRLRWEWLQPGQELMGVEQAQGLKRGEKIVKIGPIRVVSVEREPLNAITPAQVVAEGFPGMTTAQFVKFFCDFNKCAPDATITRIVFEYIEER
jgi:hypothetical protein